MKYAFASVIVIWVLLMIAALNTLIPALIQNVLQVLP